MNGIIGEFRLGEDLAVALDATTGDTALVTALTARMKPARVAGTPGSGRRRGHRPGCRGARK